MSGTQNSSIDSTLNDSDGSFTADRKDKGGTVKRTRVRLSFVCQSCRRRKIKCDKTQPACGRCTKLHLECIYDYKDQIQQKSVKTKSHSLHEQFMELENKFDDLWQGFNGSVSKDGNSLMGTKRQHIKVNFFDGLLPSCMGSEFKHDYKPFSDMAMIQKHSRLNPFLKLVTKSFNPMSQAVQRIIHSLGEKIEPGSDETDSVAHILFLTPEVRETLKRNRMNPNSISGELVEAVRRCLLEKSNDREASVLSEPIELQVCAPEKVLTQLSKQIISSLPRREQIDVLLQYFMRVVYPIVPYVNITDLEAVIAESLSFSPTGQVIALEINSKNRSSHRIGCMAILLVILRISYTAMMLAKRPFKGEITNNVIFVAQKCLSYLISNSHKTNEDIMSCLILMRWSLLFSPREGEILAGSITDSILSAITNHAVKMGLYRDCIQVNSTGMAGEELTNHIQYRSKLWMGTLILLRSDMCLRGNFPMLSREYFTMVIKDKSFDYYENKTESEIHKILHTQLELYSELSVFDKLSLSLHETVDIDDIYPQLRKVEYKQELFCPLPDSSLSLKDNSRESILQSMTNAMNLKVNIMIKIYFLAIRASIICNLENQIKERGTNFEYIFSRYKDLFVECFENALSLATILETYMNSLAGDDGSYVISDHRYVLNKIVQIGIFRVSYFLVGMVLSMLHVKGSLSRIMWEHKNQLTLVTEVDYKISIIDSISKKVFSYLQKFVELGSLTLADRYFTSFKQFLFLDHAIQVIQNELIFDTPSQLDDVLNLENLPVAMDYSPSDWERLLDFVSKSLDQDDLESAFASADDILADTIIQPLNPPEGETFQPVLQMDDELNIQSMLNGDYTWSDMI